jgi:4-hydroxy-tetrahydrodipicolinate reductase
MDRTAQRQEDTTAVRVAVCGARGRMGQEMILGLSEDPELQVVGGCDPRPPLDGAPPSRLSITPSLGELLDLAPVDVCVDFTTAEGAASNAAEALSRSVPIVIGTTGLSQEQLQAIDELARASNTAVLVAPNFAIGAVLLAKFAATASKFFDSAEVIEIHHDGKIDAPSGTALMIAQGMREGRGRPFAGDNVSKHVLPHSRGAAAEDVHVHSLRMPGSVATHEVVFGGPGQSLTIRHDSIGRDSFVPGVIYAIKHLRGHVGLVYGLDQLMGLT